MYCCGCKSERHVVGSGEEDMSVLMSLNWRWEKIGRCEVTALFGNVYGACVVRSRAGGGPYLCEAGEL